MSIKKNGEVAHYIISKFRAKRAKFWRPVGALRSATKPTVWPRDVVDRSSFRIASCSTSWAILIVKEFRKELSTLKEPVWITQFLDRKFLDRKFTRKDFEESAPSFVTFTLLESLRSMNALDKRAWELSNDIKRLNLNESINPKLLKRQITKKNATNLNKSLFYTVRVYQNWKFRYFMRNRSTWQID